MIGRIYFFVLALLCLISCRVSAQEFDLQPKSIYSGKPVQIGEPFEVSLYVRYPSNYQILFPDTNFVFGNCVLRERNYFPTLTKNEISRDCVVYQLACFDPTPRQTFNLPVIRFQAGDSLSFSSNDVVLNVLSGVQGPIPKNPVFQSNTSFLPVDLKLNYPYIVGIFGLILFLVLGINFFFDKPIQKYFYLLLERRRHLSFMKSFDRMATLLEKEGSIGKMEGLLVVWKGYLQRVDGNPFMSFTSLEISRLLPDPNLKKALQEIDRWIYGGVGMENRTGSILILKEKSIEMYEKKRELIRNGKLGKAV